MATTQYLNLNKPTGSDLVNPLTDTFPNWDIVDTAYHELDSRAIGHATEIVSQGVHAITRIDQYTKTFKFIATANYEAGETFTVDGVQVNAYTPSGSALATGSYVSGAVVIASLNADDSAITIYVGGQQTADNSLRLGGQLPSYYATQSDVDNLDTNVTNLKNLTGNNSIVGIGDGTTTGAIAYLNEKVGGGMKCAKFGTYQLTNNNKSATIDISDLVLTSADDYMVILDCQGHPITTSATTTGAGSVSLTAKTATSFTVTSKTVANVDGSYQVITFR